MGTGDRMSMRFVREYDATTDTLLRRIDVLYGIPEIYPDGFSWHPLVWFWKASWLWRHRVIPAWRELRRPVNCLDR